MKRGLKAALILVFSVLIITGMLSPEAFAVTDTENAKQIPSVSQELETDISDDASGTPVQEASGEDSAGSNAVTPQDPEDKTGSDPNDTEVKTPDTDESVIDPGKGASETPAKKPSLKAPVKAPEKATGRQPAVEDTVYVQTEAGPQLIRSVSVTIAGMTTDENNLYNLKTGQDFVYTVAVSNEDNSQLSDIIRIYHDFSGTGYEIGSFPVSSKPYTLRNTSGTEYTMWVKACKDDAGNVLPGKFYYELTGIQPGETLAFHNDILYNNASSAGGNAKIWTVALKPEDSAALNEKYIEPTAYVEAQWTTSPGSFTIAKNNATSIGGTSVTTHFEGDGSDSDTVYLKNLGYTLTESYKSNGSDYGKDYVRTVDYEDVLSIPEGADWADGIIEAVENGDYVVRGGTVRSAYGTYYGYSVYAKVNGKEILIASLHDRAYESSGNYTNGIKGLKPSVVTGADGKKTIKVSWHCDNPQITSDAARSEYTAKTFSIVYGDQAIAGSIDVLNEKLDAGEKLTFHNDIDETRHYSWSGDQKSHAERDKDISLDASLETAKYWLYNNSNYVDYYGGTDTPCVLYMRNTGIANLKDWGITDANGKKQPMISDTMTYTFYIKPENIEKMFKDTATVGKKSYNVGDWLDLTITNASLFTVNEGNETEYGQEMWAEDGPNKYTNSNPTTDNSQLTNSARITFKNVDGVLTMTVSSSGSAGKDGTYTIGEGGQYETLEEAFNAIGFMPTRNTAYSLTYQPPDDTLMLAAGQVLKINVPLTMKTTFMLLDGDAESCYGNNDMSGYNSATFRAHYADKDQVTTRSTYRRDWYRDAFIYKNGYIASKSSSISGSNTLVDDGSVIDYNVYFYRNNQNAITQYYDYTTKSYKTLSQPVYPSYSYEKMPITDLVSGAQIVLVPKDYNPTLTAPDGSALDTIDVQGMTYWKLTKPGTYTNLIFGTSVRVGSSGTPVYRQCDSITVTDNGKSGISTVIKWKPLENWGGRQSNSSSGSGTTNMWYKVLVSGADSGMIEEGSTEGSRFNIRNKCWMGDHQRHRLYDTMDGYFWIYGFSKYIATGNKDGSDTVAAGTLIKEKRIRKGEVVTYQMQVSNISDGEVYLNGANLYDALPQTRGKFSWRRGDSANVRNLRYVPDNAEVQIVQNGSVIDKWTGQADGSWQNGVGDDHWSIQNTGRNPSQAQATGQQYIVWDDDFRIKMPAGSSVKILVDIEFPAEGDGDTSVWANFVEANNGANVYNTFNVHEQNSWRSDSVSHLPIADGKAVLRKGVYDTGWTTRYGSSVVWGHRYTSRKTRKTFANSGDDNEQSTNLHASTVTYYTEIYNGSNERLYLEPLQDKLPKGFTFNSMVNLNYHSTTDWDSYSEYNSYPGYVGIGRRPSAKYTYTEYSGNANQKLATVDNSIDDKDNHTVTYKSAYVTPSTKKVGANQYVTFTLTKGTYGNLGYDSVVGKYYLDPGQAVRFGYNVVPGRYADTDDVAINTIGMPYYNYYSTGFEMDNVEKLKPSQANGLERNDGGCEQMTSEEVKKDYGFDVSKYEGVAQYETEEEGNWLVSSVTVERDDFIPGNQKSVGGYTLEKTNVTSSTIQGSQGSDSALYGTAYSGGVHKNHVINWRIRAFSEANTMTDYTIVDTVDQPYLFTGQVFYNAYDMNGVRQYTYGSTYLFTIGSRTEGDTAVRIGAGSGYSSARNVKIGKAEDDSDDDWYSFGSASDGSQGRVKIEKLEDGREQITIQLTGKKHSIAENSYMDFALHTQFCSDTVVISEGKYNDSVVIPSEDYRTAAVTKGRPLTHSEIIDGKRVTINDGVQSGASLMVVQGYTTASHKTVSELKDPSNKADSDASNNYIVLAEKENAFRYDCYVTGPKALMSKIVLIDSLPEEGDHSAFIDADKRNSEFTVKLLSDPDFYVSLKKPGGKEVALTEDQYTIEGSTRTEFSSADWNGETKDWVDISTMSEEELKNVRSIRLIIEDPNAWQAENTSLYMMPNETQIRFAFNAVIDDPEAAPGEYAWNSFGYYYTVVQNIQMHIPLSLMAQPLAAGVRYPCAPELTKKLVDDEGNEYKSTMDLTFNFIVYKGEKINALDNALNMTEEEIARALEGRDYILVPVQVKEGESEGKVTFWNTDYKLAGYDGGWTEKDEVIHWLDGEQFNVIELPLGQYRYEFTSLNEGANNLTFIQNTREVLQFEAINTKLDERMEVRGRKVWDDDDDRDGVRPGTITVELYADGEMIDTAEVGEDSEWGWKFTDLPRYNEDGTEVEYEVREQSVDGYTTAYEVKTLEPSEGGEGEGEEPSDPAEPADGTSEPTDPSGTAADPADPADGASDGTDPSETDPAETGTEDDAITLHTIDVTVTNTHEAELTQIAASKVWDDENDKDGIRPASVTFRLMADGEEAGSAEVSEKTGWKAEFTDLPKYRDHGKEISYTVNEDEVSEYKASAEQVSDTEWEITNKHDVVEPPVPPEPRTGDDTHLMRWIGCALAAAGLVICLIVLRKNRKNQQ